MFCPVCKYEFRRGFTHCNQCDVDLVDALPPEEEADHAAPTAAATLDHPTLLWSGASSAIFSALTLALDEAHVPYNKEELDARLLFTSQHGALEVWVPVANLPQAQPILQSILANPLNSDPAASAALDAANQAAAFPDEEGEEDFGDVRMDNAARELYPEDATAEVWSGPDESTAEILKSCLAEIGVACYIQRPDADTESDLDSTSPSAARANSASTSDAAAATESAFAVCVLPEDESRACEIVRQVTNAAPPE
ncbi:MAG TPA: hypothetical protein VKS20_02835 [Candidatus Acidoferrales bacterium]|nr:hypothetical protein [Candidatus Acidoferrales bacterium]